MTTIGILHPGAMGAAVGSSLVAVGHEVVWASSGRSADTAARAADGGLRDVGSVPALVAAADVVLSICPPDAAEDLAAQCRGARRFVDANAISPRTAERIAGLVGDAYVDGSIMGGPPVDPGTTRLYLSGPHAASVAALFDGAALEARVLDGAPFSASTLKMAYASWTKGSQALLLAAHRAAVAGGVEEFLRDEWFLSQPHLAARLAAAESAAAEKGWRWAGEMREIAATFDDLGQPDGFHRAAAEIFERGHADRRT